MKQSKNNILSFSSDLIQFLPVKSYNFCSEFSSSGSREEALVLEHHSSITKCCDEIWIEKKEALTIEHQVLRFFEGEEWMVERGIVCTSLQVSILLGVNLENFA
jgi:hypothetical protein